MARIHNGIMDKFSGKVGTVIGGSWRGIHYMRGKPTPRVPKKATPKQLAQRKKISLASSFAYSLKTLYELSFKKFAIEKTGTNCAVSYLSTNAITGSYPDLALDMSKVLVSRGELPGVVTPNVTSTGEGILQFTWTNNSEAEGAQFNDRAIVVAYCSALKTGIYTTVGATRKAGIINLDVQRFSGQRVHTYIGFMTEDGEAASDSVYTGQLMVL